MEHNYGIQPLCLRYREHISCFMYKQSKRAGMINLVVHRLNVYVGKERIHCLSVVRLVAMTQMQLSRWSGATEIQNNSSLLVITGTRRVILDFMCCT